MASTIILSDNGVSSGSAGLKETGGNDGVLILQTTTSGGTATNALYIDTSQNVGIGTSSPATNLHIQASTQPTIQLTDVGTGAGRISMTNAMIFGVDGSDGSTERMRIDSSGNVGIGITSPSSYSAKLAFAGSMATTGSQMNFYNSGDYEFVQRAAYKMNFYVNAATVMASLSITGVWTNASDARYKENIVDSQYGLSTVMALQPRSYNLIGLEDKPQVGFIAQEVLEVVPEVVESVRNSVTEEDRYTLSYGNLTAVLTKAIQEQQALITTLTERLDALENK